MSLRDYFTEKSGLGVFSTADREGRVNAAIYARPHVLEDETVAFITTDRLTHANLQSNPHACYLFKEDGPGYRGKRLILTKVREEEDEEKIAAVRRKTYPAEDEAKVGKLFLVYFSVDEERLLLGSGPREGQS